jgi:hypothetical protein
MLNLIQLLSKVAVALMFHISMLGVFTIIWISFDYYSYDSCDTKSDCFISYIDERVKIIVDASNTSL